MKNCRLAILVSGNGTNLQAILDAIKKDAIEDAIKTGSGFPAEVALVLSNNAQAYALERARQHNISTVVIDHHTFKSREDFEKGLIAAIDSAQADLVVLAGFMRVLSPFFVKYYKGRILNIHPALLPSFPGTHAIQQAWDYGVRVTGVTVHFVDEGTDTGPVVLQEAVPISEKESLESLEKKIHAVEHRLFPEAIRLYAEGRLTIKDNKGRKVFIGERA